MTTPIPQDVVDAALLLVDHWNKEEQDVSPSAPINDLIFRCQEQHTATEQKLAFTQNLQEKANALCQLLLKGWGFPEQQETIKVACRDLLEALGD